MDKKILKARLWQWERLIIQFHRALMVEALATGLSSVPGQLASLVGVGSNLVLLVFYAVGFGTPILTSLVVLPIASR